MISWALLVAALLPPGDDLEAARLLLRRGFLEQAEQCLLALEDVEASRGRVLLLLGNVDYERGLYAAAAGHYSRAEESAAGDAELAAIARDNRRMAEERIERGREVASRVAHLQVSLLSLLAAAAASVTWLGRRSRPAAPSVPPR